MYARVSRYRGKPGQVKEAFSKPDPPELHEVKGYRGAWVLVDEESGRAITMTLWESKEAMERSTELASRLRSEASEEAGGLEPPTYETYEAVQRPEEREAAAGRS